MLTLGLSAVAVIVVIWLGYPLLVRALAALRRPLRDDPSATLPTVSVILASRDDPESIRARVSDLLAAQYPLSQMEIIVARDAARAPDDAAGADSFGPAPTVRVVEGDAPGGKSATLNAGVRAARNEILVFADTAQRFNPGAIRALVSHLQRPRLGAVSGMLEITPRPHGGLNLAERYWRYERWLRLWEARLHSGVGVTGAIYAMPRRLWEPLPANLILDDVYVPMRLALQGWRIGFTASALARDVRQFEPAQEYRRKVRTLTGVIQVCAWLPGVLNPMRNPIWLQFVFHKLLRLLTPYLAALALVGIAWAAVSMLLSMPGGVPILVLTVLLAAAVCLVPRVRQSLKGRLAWGVALQSSIVVATVNGLRGRWDVWR
jgi:cellulose synthase/poly-beta-1,6-N-acetylglucosamine synthase-like glycosyltransferase